MILQLRAVGASYEELPVLHDISLDIKQGEFVGIIGPNGAGKSTLARAIMGDVALRVTGQILFEGSDITKVSMPDRVALGMSYVPGERRLFPMLSVLENLKMGSFLRRARSQRDSSLKRVFELFPRLFERRDQLAGTLSGGEQQMLAIARGLMSLPKLLIVDEPSLGLAPQVVDEMLDAIVRINHEGVTVLLIEQDTQRSLEICERAYVLEGGGIVLSGSGQELLNSDHVRRAYLG